MANDPTTSTAATIGRLRRWTALAVSVALSGCLGPSYVVPKSELRRLAQVEPARRGDKLHVVQRFATADEPPPAPSWPAPPPRPARAPDAHPDGDLNGGAWWWWWGPPGRPIVQPRWHVSSSSAAAGGTPPMGGVTTPQRAVPDGIGAGAKAAAGGATGTGGSDLGKTLAVAAAAAVVAGIGLAATEGARYDGWVAVHPAHPVHLVGPRSHRVVPLWQLAETPPTEQEEAIVVRHEGAGMWLRGRRPLDRVGFGYGFDGSSQQLALGNGEFAALGGSTIQFGFWPVWFAGVEFGAMMGWGSDATGFAVARVQPRIALEVIPIRLWRLHLGGMAATGIDIVRRDRAGNDRDALVSSVGPMLQLDLTTRLALTARWQWTMQHDGAVPTSTSFGLGLSIY